MADVFCRNCGVRLRRGFLSGWRHERQLGPVACSRAEPEVPSRGDQRTRIDLGGIRMSSTQTAVDEIADGIFRLATFVPEIGPSGFTFNQFLIRADQPLLFHTGPRAMFPSVRAAVATLIDPSDLRWITFGHVEADECGAMNLFLAAAPRAEVAHGATGCLVSLNDLADRPPRALADGEVIDLGGKRVRHIDTPHVPHGWDARVLFEETTATLFCGDLFTSLGNGPALSGADPVGPADAAESIFRSTGLTPDTAPTLRRLAELNPTTLAIMHGSSFAGDGADALVALADSYAARLEAASCA